MKDLQRLRVEVVELAAELDRAALAQAASLRAVEPRYTESARNFVHYVALRQHDLRSLQRELWRRGFSSLGRLEGYVLHALDNLRERLDEALIRRCEAPAAIGPRVGITWDDAERLLHEHTRDLLGAKPRDRHVYIMVTAPDAKEVDDAWAEGALEAGMNLLRINAAHEDERAWAAIVETVRRAAQRRGVALRVAVDLPGPKLRTVALVDGPRVVRWRPQRDALGRVIQPCVVTLRPASRPANPDEVGRLAVPDASFADLAPGDRLIVLDARDKQREIVVTERGGDVARGELRATAYVIPGVRVVHWRGDHELAAWCVEQIPATPFRVALCDGDRLRLLAPGQVAPAGESLPALGCTLAAALTALRPGHRVIFDDGHIHGVAEVVDAHGAILKITRVPGGRAKLGGEKGINLPDSELDLPLFGPDDERALAFAVRSADLVEASFIRGPEDVRELHRRLLPHDRHVAVVLKIETRGAFTRLPAILLAAMERYPTGVMIARGDLAIEAGFERLAELQEEILWLCEDAHLPVIWATQVLEGLARSGQPSRAEVTDAAMSVRAECAMLNKGSYIIEAIRALDNIIRRMEQHHYKKRSLYRRLHLAFEPPRAAPQPVHDHAELAGPPAPPAPARS